MQETDIVFLYVTTKDLSQAKQIAKTLRQERLIACANILPQMISLYEWNNEQVEDEESVLILKTKKSWVEACEKRILALHSYETPCILELDVQRSNASYLGWLDSQFAKS